jgi:hypothetical protein
MVLPVLALLACSSRHDKACEAFSERLAACNRSLPAATMDNVYRHCSITLAYQPAPDDHPQNMSVVMRATFEQCSAETACDAMFACLDRRGCQLVLTGPDDRVPELFCGAPR